ncbi:MAG: membrane integrity-associated transporter subunit PqiC [Methylocapsa sp.]|nr:membrane integrity-associated transporter subunit PqiC [Methylocapsa sp.]
MTQPLAAISRIEAARLEAGPIAEMDLMRSYCALRLPFPGNLLLAAIAALLSACASAPKLTYDLNPVRGAFGPRAADRQLAIAIPDATLPENSSEIVVRTSPESVAYLSGAQWADRLPILIQSRLIESFQNAHVLRGAGGPGILADATLQTNLRRFEYDAGASLAAVEISAQLTGTSGRVIAARRFTANVPVPSSEPPAVAAALDAGLSKIMREIVLWAAPKV